MLTMKVKIAADNGDLKYLSNTNLQGRATYFSQLVPTNQRKNRSKYEKQNNFCVFNFK